MSLGSNLINFGIAVYITLGEGEMTVSLFLKKMLVGVLHSKCNFFFSKIVFSDPPNFNKTVEYKIPPAVRLI